MLVWKGWAVAAAVLAAAPVAACEAQQQARPVPYSTFAVRIAALQSVDEGALASWWRAGRGGGIELHTPLPLGAIGGLAYAIPYAARGDSQPDFRAYLVGVDWRFALPAARWIRPTVSVAAGDFLNMFEGVTAKGLARESEIFVGGTAGVAVPIGRATQLAVSAVGVHVLTSTTLRLGYVTAGIAHTVRTPRWLQGVVE